MVVVGVTSELEQHHLHEQSCGWRIRFFSPDCVQCSTKPIQLVLLGTGGVTLSQTRRTPQHIVSCCSKALDNGRHRCCRDQVLNAIANTICSGIEDRQLPVKMSDALPVQNWATSTSFHLTIYRGLQHYIRRSSCKVIIQWIQARETQPTKYSFLSFKGLYFTLGLVPSHIYAGMNLSHSANCRFTSTDCVWKRYKGGAKYSF